MSNPSFVWYQVYLEGRDESPIGKATKIRPIPEDIDDLKAAVNETSVIEAARGRFKVFTFPGSVLSQKA